MTALLFVLSAVLCGPTLDALRGAILATACVILVGTDLQERILPDEVTLGAAALGVSLSLVEDLTRGGGFSMAGSRFICSALGAAAGGGLLLAVRAVHLRVRHVEGLGLGDVKMLAMIDRGRFPRVLGSWERGRAATVASGTPAKRMRAAARR